MEFFASSNLMSRLHIFLIYQLTRRCLCAIKIYLSSFLHSHTPPMSNFVPSPGFGCPEDSGAVPPCHLARSAGHETRRSSPTACLFSSPWLSRPAASSLQQQHGCLCHGRHWGCRRGTATSACHGGCALSRPPHHNHPQQVRSRRNVWDDSSCWRVGWLWFWHAWLQAVT